MNEFHAFPSIREDVTGVLKLDQPNGVELFSDMETVHETAIFHKILIPNCSLVLCTTAPSGPWSPHSRSL